MAERDIHSVAVSINAHPDPDAETFRIGAADEILRLLADAHETEFTIPKLVDATGVTRSTVWRAVDLLDSVGAVQIRKTPQRNYVGIDPDRLQITDLILAIDQLEFHAPFERSSTEFERLSQMLTTSTRCSASLSSEASPRATLTARATSTCSSSSTAIGRALDVS